MGIVRVADVMKIKHPKEYQEKFGKKKPEDKFGKKLPESHEEARERIRLERMDADGEPKAKVFEKPVEVKKRK